MIYILLFLTLMIGLFVLSKLKMKKAIKVVITNFYKKNALTEIDALTLEELDLKPRGFLQNAFEGRDYRPYAIQFLKNRDIIQVTEGGRLFLSKEKLVASGIDN